MRLHTYASAITLSRPLTGRTGDDPQRMDGSQPVQSGSDEQERNYYRRHNMNGYATLTADEHEEEAEYCARYADLARQGKVVDLVCPDSPRNLIRVYQNLAVLHMEDAQRIRNQA
jgi:hypothetical protein